MFPFIALLQQGYALDSADVPLVASQSTYNQPTRAASFREVCFVDANGNEGKPLVEISPTDVWRYNPSSGSGPLAFYWLASQIVVIPAPTVASGSLRFKYVRRPGALVIDTVTSSQHVAVGTVASATSTVITLAANHNGFPASTTIDVCGASNPFTLKAKDIVTTTAVAGTATIAVATDLTTGVNAIAAGDYVTLANKTFVPQYPAEFHELLVLYCAARIHGMRRKDAAKRETLEAIGMARKALTKMFAPRSSGNLKKASAWRV